MARQIIINHQGKENKFEFSKVDRSKLYGSKKRVPVDQKGEVCESASIDVETGILLRTGMTSQGYFIDRRWIPNKDLVGLDEEGNELELQASTLGVAQEVSEAHVDDVLGLRVSSIYALNAEELDADLGKALAAGSFFKVPFNYRADYQLETGILLSNKNEEIFLLVGQPEQSEWATFETKAPEETGDDDDDLDFEMF